jgi:hypothetical protein
MHIARFVSLLAVVAFGSRLPCVSAAPADPTYTIATVVGSGPGNVETGGFGGDGGPASRAVINQPTSFAIDRAGNLIFCDWNARIREVDGKSGVITTIAGMGSAGYSGDDGPAVKATLGGPGDLAIDAASNIYFADVYNHRVRKISAETGMISTIAGTGSEIVSGDGKPAVEAGIGFIAGIAVDASGDVYFGSCGDRVRKIEAATGIITTVAGGHGSYASVDGQLANVSSLDQPEGFAFDREGNLFIAARGEQRVRKVSGAGIITTVAGSTSGFDAGIMGMWAYEPGFSGDGGPATAAALNDPSAIALDDAGNLYISDTMNYRIRRVDAITGEIRTIAGTGVKGFSGDGGPAIKAQITTPSGIFAASDGRIYFGDLFNHRIRVLVPVH